MIEAALQAFLDKRFDKLEKRIRSLEERLSPPDESVPTMIRRTSPADYSNAKPVVEHERVSRWKVDPSGKKSNEWLLLRDNSLVHVDRLLPKQRMMILEDIPDFDQRELDEAELTGGHELQNQGQQGNNPPTPQG